MAGSTANPEALKKLEVDHILVLGGGGPADHRVTEGIRLWRHLPHARLLVSGGREGEIIAIKWLPLEMGVTEDAFNR